MITTVTLNAAVDKTYYVDGWKPGGVFRVKRMLSEPGGKGNNVAKVIRQLGGEVCATGFCGGSNGAFIKAQLELKGIRTKFVEVQGESRICLNIINEPDGKSTELLESGPAISPEKQAELKATVRQLAARSSAVVFSGSLPDGVAASMYKDLVELAKSAGAKAYLDTSGAPLRMGLSAKPDFIKPNEQELMQLLGKDTLDERELPEIVRQLSDAGVPLVCVTLGERGTIAAVEREVFRVVPPSLKAVNPVGCGDSFLAGMVFAFERGERPERCLQIASAAAAANAMSEQAGNIDVDVFNELLPYVQVMKL
jgi:1-phosphofructokinase family hexose kinase